MKKRIQTFLAIVLSISNINAQNTVKKELNEVIVSSTRAKSTKNISNIQLISAEEIENAAVQTVEDILEYAMNIDIRQRGGQGVQADISMRAGTSEQVLVMLNGIKLNDSQTGHHTMNIPVSIDQIERIEVITGGTSRTFGNYAYTGAINIITKEVCPISASISAGEDGFKSIDINTHVSENNIKHNLSLGKKESDGYIDGTDYTIKNLYYQGSTTFDNIKALLNFGIIDKEFGAQSFYTPKYPNQFEKTNTTFASLQLNRKGKISIENKFYWRKNNDEFILFRENPEWYHNFHQTNTFGMDINVIKNTELGSNVIGMEIKNDNIISNLLGDDLKNPIEIDADNNYTKGASRTTTNLFAEKNIQVDKLSLSAGVMMNIDSKYGNEYFPGIDLGIDLSNQINIFSSYNKSMRTPNYTELYYKDPANEGNEFLKSEHSINTEAGFKWKTKSQATTVSFYSREGSNMIDWMLASGDSIWRTKNISKLTTRGYEINSKININSYFNTNLPINDITINYAVNNSDTSSTDFQSKSVLDHLRNKFSISSSHTLLRELQIGWNATYQKREGNYINYTTQNEIEYPGFWLVGVKAKWSYESLSLFVEINNLLDQQYVDFGNIPQNGRWMRAGMKITL